MTDLLVSTIEAMIENVVNIRRTTPNRNPVGSVAHEGVLYHLRPTKAGITVVSTADKNPQMGLDIEKKKWLGPESILWDQFGKVPGRLTPEKQVQAQLIGSALRNHRLLPSALAPDACTLTFLVDELVVQSGPGAKNSRRGDITAFCTRRDGSVVPAFIELKSDRQSGVLQEQVASMFSAFHVGPQSEVRLAALHRFAEAVTGKDLPAWSKVGPHHALGIMVWPATVTAKRQTPRRIPDFPELELRVVGYHTDFIHEPSTIG